MHTTPASRPGPVHGLLALVAPPRCLACRRRGRTPWCGPCRDQVRRLPDGCRRCAAPRGGAHACWPASAPIASVTAGYDYRGVVAAAIATAKLSGARAGWPGLAEELIARLAARPPPVDAVTWVTTPPARARRRGADHAACLARLVGDGLGLSAVPLLEAVAGGDGRDRYRAVTPLPGSDLLLVDDVLTTGATAWRAADALTRAGAGGIHLAVLARAGSHALGAGR